MGHEWQTMRGLEILRINPIKQVLYVKGAVPGDIGEILIIKVSFKIQFCCNVGEKIYKFTSTQRGKLEFLTKNF